MTKREQYADSNFLFGIDDAVDTAVERIRDAYRFSTRLGLGKLFVCFSGGKDSEAVYGLCRRAFGERVHECCDFVYNLTGIDPPELVWFIRKNFPDVTMRRADTTIWQLCVRKHIPPTRIARYCCSELKESGGEGRFVITGVRWAESIKRKNNRGVYETYTTTGKAKILNADNAADRRVLEHCVPKRKYICNPIVDWGKTEVWRFIVQEGMPYCSLYDEGFERLGCIGCPMVGKREREREFARWPKFREQWVRTFQRMVDKRKADGLPTEWTDGKQVFDFWLEDKR